MKAKLSVREREKQRKALVTGADALIKRLKESNDALVEADRALTDAARTIRRLRWAVVIAALVPPLIGAAIAGVFG